MTLLQLEDWFQKEGITIHIPRDTDTKYGNYFIRAVGCNWDFVVCENIQEVCKELEEADIHEFDNFDELSLEDEPILTIRCIPMSKKQSEFIKKFIDNNSLTD